MPTYRHAPLLLTSFSSFAEDWLQKAWYSSCGHESPLNRIVCAVVCGNRYGVAEWLLSEKSHSLLTTLVTAGAVGNVTEEMVKPVSDCAAAGAAAPNATAMPTAPKTRAPHARRALRPHLSAMNTPRDSPGGGGGTSVSVGSGARTAWSFSLGVLLHGGWLVGGEARPSRERGRLAQSRHTRSWPHPFAYGLRCVKTRAAGNGDPPDSSTMKKMGRGLPWEFPVRPSAPGVTPSRGTEPCIVGASNRPLSPSILFASYSVGAKDLSPFLPRTGPGITNTV